MLPLEQVSYRRSILACVIKLCSSLNCIEDIARVEFIDKYAVIHTVFYIDGLLQHLPHRKCLRHISIDLTCGTTILSEVILYHLSVLETIGLRISTIRNKYCLGIFHATNAIDKVLTQIRSGCCDNRFRVIVFFLKYFDVSCSFRKQSAKKDHICVRLNYLLCIGLYTVFIPP